MVLVMDLATGQAIHTTTIQIPMALRVQIKEKGMTIPGALKEGWKALNERPSWNEELREVQANMDKYRAQMMRYQLRLKELGEKIEND